MDLDVLAEHAAKILLGAVITAIIAALKKLWNSEKATKQGTQSLLRADIIRSYEKYSEKGFCPIYARDALEKEYDAYHALGGNGMITDLMAHIHSLPTEPPEGDEK